MADKSLIGKRYTFTWLVEKGKIREFVTAIGDDNPIYQDAKAALDQGYKNIVAPPTFTTVPILWTGTLFKAFDNLQLVLTRITHAEQTYEYYQDIFVGDELKGVMEIKEITEKKGRSGLLEFIRFETTFTNQHGQLVSKENMLVAAR